MPTQAPFEIAGHKVAPGTRAQIDLPISILPDHTPVGLSLDALKITAYPDGAGEDRGLGHPAWAFTVLMEAKDAPVHVLSYMSGLVVAQSIQQLVSPDGERCLSCPGLRR